MATRLNRDAATLQQKRKELAAIQDVELPQLYVAIGERVASLPKVPQSLTPYLERLRSIEKTSGKGAGVPVEARQRDAYVALGRAAFEQYGSKAVPKNIAPDLMRLTERQRALTAEVAALQEQRRPKARWPMRLLLTAAGCAGLAGVFWAVRSFEVLPTGKERGSSAGLLTPIARGKNDDASASSHGSHQRLRVDKDAVRAFEKAVVARSEQVKAECTKRLDGLRDKNGMDGIQAGYDATLAAWKKTVLDFVAPLEKEPLLKNVPFLADKTVRQEVLGGAEATLNQELADLVDQLARQVASQKQSVDNAFGGLNDLGQRFDRPIDQRQQLVNQSCSSLSVAFDNATTRLASRRLDVFREAVALVETKISLEEDRKRMEQAMAERALAAEHAKRAAEEAERERVLAERKASEDARAAATRVREAADATNRQRVVAASESRHNTSGGDATPGIMPEAAPRGPSPQAEYDANVIPRQFFDAHIAVGMTMDEVRRVIGMPDYIDQWPKRVVWWYDRVKDEKTGKGHAFVSFDRQSGRAAGVRSQEWVNKVRERPR
jgi:hypothetical protein